MVQQISTNTFGCAKWIVSADATQGTHTTIASALTSASSGDTILVRDGTYTEDLTMKAGVTLAALGSADKNPNVTIIGNLTYTASGVATISNIRLQTNSNFFITVSGANASILNLSTCFLNCSNNTGISFTNSNTASVILANDCRGNLVTTGIALFSMSSLGSLTLEFCDISNTGTSLTASTASAGIVGIYSTLLGHGITTSSAGAVSIKNSSIQGVGNVTALTHGGSVTSNAVNSQFNGGSASSISVGTGSILNITLCDILSTNTNAITGLGTLQYGGLTFSGSSSLINTTTLSGRNTDTGGISFDGGNNVLSAYTASSAFTPVLAFGGASVGITYSSQIGRYQRVGNLVFIKVFIVLTSKGSSTGVASLTGLPVTSASDSATQNLSFTSSGFTVATATYYTAGIASASASVILSYGVAATGTITQLADTNFSGTDTIRIEGFYFV